MKTRTKPKPNGRYQILSFPAFKLAKRLNELDRDGWELREVLTRDTATVRCLMEAKGKRQ